MSNKPSVDMELNIAYVRSGGNTADGQYFYSFKPNIINITESNTDINFKLAPESVDRYELLDVFCNDNFEQIGETRRTSDLTMISVTDSNTRKQLTLFSVLARDTKNPDIKINCDPQATN